MPPAEDFLSTLSAQPDRPIREILKPYLTRETHLRELFKTDPSNPILSDPTVGLVPIYAGKQYTNIEIKARDVSAEDEEERGKYILPLNTSLPDVRRGVSPDWRYSGKRQKTEEPAIVGPGEFKTNFESFCNGALTGIDWTNIIVAGGAVLLPLLGYNAPIQKHSMHTHDPSIPEDINIFLHNTNETSALEILETLEETIQSNIRRRTMCVRTKNAITILSRDPYIPIRITLRLYHHSISEILHDITFDVDCTCVAYDGRQVYALPRAVVAWMERCNTIREVHSSWGKYEHRLLKWRFRGFEVYHPKLDRRRVLPGLERVEMSELWGLARLLVFEKYGNADEHTADLRVNSQRQFGMFVDHIVWDTGKEEEWGVPIIVESEQEGDGVGRRMYSDGYYRREGGRSRTDASAVEEVIYKNDEILNKKGKVQGDRVGYLHRHRAFVGSMRYVFKDCCRRCPEPQSKEEEDMQALDDKIYIRGKMTFAAEEYTAENEAAWTETAIMADNTVVAEAIVAQDANAVRKWVEETRDSNLSKFARRLDGRDATSRTVLQLAVIGSSPDIVKILIEAGANMTIQTIDGRNLLHLAAARGETEIMQVLLLKNEENEERLGNSSMTKTARRFSSVRDTLDDTINIDGTSATDDESFYEVSGNSVTSSFVHIDRTGNLEGDSRLNSVFNEILDINMADKTNHMTPLHYAILHGHTNIVKLLVSDFGADVLLPLTHRSVKKLVEIPTYHRTSNETDSQLEIQPGLLPLCLPLHLGKSQREDMLRLLLRFGASSAQCDASGIPALLRVIQQSDLTALRIIFEEDGASAFTTARTIYQTEQGVTNALITAYDKFPVPIVPEVLYLTEYIILRCHSIIEGYEDKALFLLEKGVPPEITASGYLNTFPKSQQMDIGREFPRFYEEPAELALDMEMPDVFMKCIEKGVDPSSFVTRNLSGSPRIFNSKMTLLDFISEKFEGFWCELERLPRKMICLPDGYSPGSYEHWIAARLVKERNTMRESENKHNHRYKILGDAAIDQRKERLKQLLGIYRGLAKWLVERGGTPKSTMERAKTTLALSQNPPAPALSPQLQTVSLFKHSDKSRIEMSTQDLTMPEYLKIFDKEYAEEPEPPFKINFVYRGIKGEELTHKAYHELFTAVWDGDKERIKKLIVQHFRKDIDSQGLDLRATNQFYHNILTLAMYREHPKEVLDLLHSKAAQQGVSLEEPGALRWYNQYNPENPSKPSIYLPKEPWSLYYDGPDDRYLSQTDARPNYPKLILQQDIKALEGWIEKDGIRAILHRKVIEENLPPELQEELKGVPASSGKRNHLISNVINNIFIDDKVHFPFAIFAAYYGSHQVYDWLLTDGPEKALRKYQQSLEVRADELQGESSMGSSDNEGNGEERANVFFLQILQKADSDTIKSWMGVNHPLLIHAACMKPPDDGLSDDEKIRWYENNIRELVSRVGKEALEASNEQSEGLSPLLTAAKMRNKWAMQALINVGAQVDYTTSTLGSILLDNILLNQNFPKLSRECLSIVPRDYLNWSFRQYRSTDSYILRIVSCMHNYPKVEALKLALEYSGDMGIDFINPQGQNPIHILGNNLFSSPEELQIILDAVDNPEMLIREDKDGMIPLDLAAMSLYHGILSNRIRKVPATGLPSSNPYENTGNSARFRARKEETPYTYISESPSSIDRRMAGLKLRHGDWGTEEKQPSVVQNWIMIATATKRALEKADKRRILLSSKLEFDRQALRIWQSRDDKYIVSEEESFISMFMSSWRNVEAGTVDNYLYPYLPKGFHTKG
ncbi:hypothetical protein AA313_de0207347 [Arthrobotrys entomopaga]|nr:hypothetical protein AA313_de0207347 [Arthrobotrys entomopaga]